jgi:hypothetical protein
MFGSSFSAGHVHSPFQLEEYGGEKVVIDEVRFANIGHATEEVEPLMMKVGKTRLPVFPSSTVPHDIMALPKVESNSIECDVPEKRTVLVPKDQEYTRRLF